MGKLSQTIPIEKGGVTQQLSVYSELSEVEYKGIPVAFDSGETGYLAYGAIDDSKASYLPVTVSGAAYAVLQEIAPSVPIGWVGSDIAQAFPNNRVTFIVPAGIKVLEFRVFHPSSGSKSKFYIGVTPLKTYTVAYGAYQTSYNTFVVEYKSGSGVFWFRAGIPYSEQVADILRNTLPQFFHSSEINKITPTVLDY